MRMFFARKIASIQQKHRGTITTAVTVLITLALGIGGPAAMAGDTIPLIDRWEFDIGGFSIGSSTKVTLYSSVLEEGTRISLEDDLGFDSSKAILHIQGAVLLGERNQLSLGYFNVPRDTRQTINTEIEWGDEVFPVDATVKGFFDTTFLEFGYQYWMLSREKTALAAGLSLSWATLEAGLGIEGVDASVETDWKSDVPIPTIFVELRQLLFHRLLLDASLGYMTLSPLPDLDGNVWRSELGLEHRTFEHVGFGLRYRYDSYDIEQTDNGLLDWSFDFDLSGLEAYLHLMF